LSLTQDEGIHHCFFLELGTASLEHHCVAPTSKQTFSCVKLNDASHGC